MALLPGLRDGDGFVSGASRGSRPGRLGRLWYGAVPVFLAVAATAVIWGGEGAGAGARAGDVPAQELPEGVTPGMVERGQAIFTGPGLCYTCHGRDGRGRPDLGADLTDERWLHGDGSYPYLVRRIKEGVSAQASTSGVPMPPRAGADLTDAQVEAAAAYVWTLSRRSPGGGS